MVLGVCSASSSSSLLTDDVTVSLLPRNQPHFSFIHLRDGSSRDYPLSLHHHPLCFPLLLSSVVVPLSVALSLSLLPLPPLSAADSPEFLTDVVGFQSYKNSHTQSRSNSHVAQQLCNPSVTPTKLPVRSLLKRKLCRRHLH